MWHRIAERDLLEKQPHDPFLLVGQRRQSWRVSIGRTQRPDQRLSHHGGVVRMSERVGDQSREIVSPRASVEVAETPESETFEVRIGRFVLHRIERDGLLIAVHGITSAERKRRRVLYLRAEDFERAADNFFRAHVTRLENNYRRVALNTWR